MQEENIKRTWLAQFTDNYEGKSKEAKEVAEFIKENYKGNSYIPWATMERLTYMQDPNAVFETLTSPNGGMVFSDIMSNENEVVTKGEIVSKTFATMMSHFVKVKLTFMGKEFVEEYPIQDQDYSALKVYNHNAVNKALKRALAKVASRATGIGLKLYENKDLQFDVPEEEDKKPEIKKTTKTTKTTKKVEMTEEQKVSDILDGGQTSAYLNGERTLEPQQVQSQVTFTEEDLKQDAPVQEVVTQDAKVEENASKYSKEVVELCDLIKNVDRDSMTRVLQSLNVAILKQHGFVLNPDDEFNELCDKISHFKDVTIFTKAIKNMLG